MTKGVPKRHHYVPVFYLKKWLTSDGKLVEFSRPYRDVIERRKYPRATGFVDGLYLIDNLPDHLQAWVEQVFLQKVDSDAARARDALLVRGVRSLTRLEKSNWIRFLLSLLHRRPEKIGYLHQLWAAKIEEIDRDLRENWLLRRRPQDPMTYDEMKTTTDPYGSAKMLAQLLANVMDSKFLGDHIINMIWCVVRWKTGHPLLTSDRPLVTTNGFAQEDAHCAIALDTRTLFLAANNQRTLLGMTQMKKRLAEVYNDRVVAAAHLYAYSRDKGLHSFVANRFQRDLELLRWDLKESGR